MLKADTSPGHIHHQFLKKKKKKPTLLIQTISFSETSMLVL